MTQWDAILKPVIKEKAMLTGVEILLERMKTNPEEFIEGGFSKWSRVIDYSWQVLTEEERQALQAGMNEAKRDHFNGEVMKVLAQGHDDHLMTMELGERVYNGKRLMQGGTIGGASTNILTPDVMRQQVENTLNKQFDEAYARNDTETMKTASKLRGLMRK